MQYEKLKRFCGKVKPGKENKEFIDFIARHKENDTNSVLRNGIRTEDYKVADTFDCLKKQCKDHLEKNGVTLCVVVIEKV